MDVGGLAPGGKCGFVTKNNVGTADVKSRSAFWYLLLIRVSSEMKHEDKTSTGQLSFHVLCLVRCFSAVFSLFPFN